MTDKIKWNQEHLADTYKKMEGSTMCLSIFTQNYKTDPTALVSLCFAMMMEKPIYIIAQEGEKIPKAFMKIADGIEYYKDKDDVQRAAQKLIRESKHQ